MRHTPSPTNPYVAGRNAYAWDKTPAASAAHLDYGCHQGDFLASLRGHAIPRLVGTDVNRTSLQHGRQRFDDLTLVHVPAGEPLPFEPGEFSSASLLDVLEHLDDQHAALQDLHRVLRPDGLLIVTVPQAYALSPLDTGNLKFRFPRLHRWLYSLRHSPSAYRSRYTHHKDGLVGDISRAKGWHEHFTRAYLDRLLQDNGFQPLEFDGAAFWGRALEWLHLLGQERPWSRLLGHLGRWDAETFASMHLFCLARKR